MPGQMVQTQIRLLLEEQSDQDLHCSPFRLHRLESLLYGRATVSNFRVTTTNFLGVRIFRKFTVLFTESLPRHHKFQDHMKEQNG